MTSLDHERALDLAAAALDGPLAPADAQALARHLGGCAACHDMVRALQRDARALAELPRRDAPQRVRHTVIASLEAGHRPVRRALFEALGVSGLATVIVGGLILAGGRSPATMNVGPPVPEATWREEAPAGAALTTDPDLSVDAVARQGSRLVALGSGAAGPLVWRSLDSVRWSSVADPSPFAGSQVDSVVGSAGGFVAVGFAVGADGASEAVSWYSADGASWRRSPASTALRETAMTGVTAVRSGYLAVGLRTAPQVGAAWTSPDGLRWTPVASGAEMAGERLNAVAARGDLVVAVGQDAAGGVAWSSSDGGHSWARASVAGAPSARISGVTAGPRGFVAVGFAVGADQSVRGAAWTTSDGLHWAGSGAGLRLIGARLQAVANAGRYLIAVGYTIAGAVAFTSPDGAAWQPLPAGPGFAHATLTAVAALDGESVAAGRATAGPAVWRLEVQPLASGS